ncbi:MAG: hypothetical protein EP300_06950 [Gammaproteobacteria bacterium]|nr:MAG: hypothetical protein EP300_06950 [Gammaproteobacteria bacterium]
MTQLQRNVSLYPWFRAASDGHAWITVFFLYMSQSLPLEQVIELSCRRFIICRCSCWKCRRGIFPIALAGARPC